MFELCVPSAPIFSSMAKKGAKKAAAAVKDAMKAAKEPKAMKDPKAMKTMKAAEEPKAMKTMTATVLTNAILDREMCLSPSRRPLAGREAWSPRSWASTLSPAYSYSSCFQDVAGASP